MDKNNLSNWYLKKWKIGEVSIFLTKEWGTISNTCHNFDGVKKCFLRIGPIVLIWDK